jgi:4'-phosphopantetheinyl transferase
MGLTRRVLAGRSRCLPHEIRFVAGPTGKPGLAAVQGGDRVEFNVSHSGGLVLIALSTGTPVGVDVEAIRPMPDLQSIASTHFQAAESALLAGLPESDAQVLFYQLWTAKEAVLKATGDGIANKLGEVEVAQRATEDGGRRTEDGGRRAALTSGFRLLTSPCRRAGVRLRYHARRTRGFF